MPTPESSRPSRRPGEGETRPAETMHETAAPNRNHAELEATEITAPTASKPAASRAAAGIPLSAKAQAAGAPVGPQGRTELGDFRFVKKLGQGGMGEVFLAHQISLDRPAALKVLAKHLADKPDFVKRFYREARAMAKMDHPHAVRVFAVDEVDGIHYVAMEFVDGQSLQRWCEQLGKLSVGDALHVTLRCVEALEQAHNINLVHRDIKPDNIMLTSRGAVKVSDFGLAKALDDEDLHMTQSGTGLGTPYYMAPEQARNAKHVDGRCDIYALGVTLYHLLTGKMPFSGSSAIEVIKAKETGRFTSARKLNPSVPEKLDLILDKMLAAKPEQRFINFGEVKRHLTALGLENPSLSFVETADKFVSATAAAKPQAKSLNQVVKAKSTVESKPEAVDHSVWIVEYLNKEGRKHVVKWSTNQVLQGLRAGLLDNRAKGKKTPNDPFMPLAQYREFEKAVQGLLTKQRAEAQTGKVRELYADYQSQERWWKVKRKVRGMFSGVMGLVSLVVYLAVIGGVLYGGYTFWNNARSSMTKSLNPSSKAVPANPNAPTPQ
jgi:serine/threonine protein kinase